MHPDIKRPRIETRSKRERLDPTHTPFDPIKRAVNTAWLMGWLTGLARFRDVDHLDMATVYNVTIERLETEDLAEISREFDRAVLFADVEEDRHLTVPEKEFTLLVAHRLLPYKWEIAETMIEIRNMLRRSLRRYVGQPNSDHAVANVKTVVSLTLEEVARELGLPDRPPFEVKTDPLSPHVMTIKFPEADKLPMGWREALAAIGVSS